MLYYALIFLLVALVAGFLGFGYIEGLAASIAKVLAVLFFGVVRRFPAPSKEGVIAGFPL